MEARNKKERLAKKEKMRMSLMKRKMEMKKRMIIQKKRERNKMRAKEALHRISTKVISLMMGEKSAKEVVVASK